MRQIRITRPTVAGGKPVVVGDVVTVDDAEAYTLVAMKKAEQLDPRSATVGVDERQAEPHELSTPAIRRGRPASKTV